MAKGVEILQGTLDLLILHTLDLRRMHGVGIADRIEPVTQGAFVVGPGSFFRPYIDLPKKVGLKGHGMTWRRAAVRSSTPLRLWAALSWQGNVGIGREPSLQ